MSDRTTSPLSASLTPRERDILRLLATDLTHAEIAERLVVSPQTVKWYVKEIYSKLGVHSREEALVYLDNAIEQPEPSEQHRIPALVTSLVGRSREIIDLCALLRDPAVRLVTLLGPPGIGKTRLSIEIAHRLVNEFPDGVFFIAFAPLSDPALTGDAILTTLGLDASGSVPAAERLKVFLRSKRLLLVIDNFEHLLSAAPLIGELLAAAPGLKVLATSREPLHVYGEREFPVPPLDPSTDAVALFEARARAVRPDFTVDEQNAVTVTAICKRLEGLPLAIELAAARMKIYTPHALLGRLASRLNTLTGGARDLPRRQQTLRAAIAWSYDLLSPDEQRMFERFSVFDGGASVEGFVEACGFGLATDPLDGLESLVSKSLIQQTVTGDGEPRFMMYESLIEFAGERLIARGEEPAARHSHARHYLTMADWISRALRTVDEIRATALFAVEYPNMRSAWLFAAAQADNALLELASENFARLFYTVGVIHDGLALYEAAFESRQDQDTLVAGDLLTGLAWLMDEQGSHSADEIEAFAQRGLGIFERIGRPDHAVWARAKIAVCRDDQGDTDLAIEMLHEVMELSRLYRRPRITDFAELCLALIVGARDAAQAMQLLEQMLIERRRRGAPSATYLILANMVYFAIALDDIPRARSLADELMEIATATGQRKYAIVAHDYLSTLAFLDGDLERARELVLRARQYAVEMDMASAANLIDCALAIIAAMQGEVSQARSIFASVLSQVEHSSRERFLLTVGVGPFIAFAARQYEQAAELAAYVTSQDLVLGDLRPRLRPVQAQLETELGAEAYAAAYARGEAMTVEEALVLAREVAAG
ncbi:MAG: LuxR C-terminal-related transcriptional regulator [Anaerolineae bacterium]